jgi:DNA-binding transcriptional regulator/RsmH inhibitor MraZ
VVVVGGGESAEVWDRDAWRAHEGELDEKAPDLAQRLAENGHSRG